MMKTASQLSLVFAFSAGLGLFLPVTGIAQESKVRVHVTSSFGDEPVKPIKRRHTPNITMSGQGSTLDLKDDGPVTVRFGEYDIIVKLEGFEVYRTTVAVNQPEQVIQVAMKLGAYEAPPITCSILGRLSPVQTGVSVRLLQVFGDQLVDVPAKLDGSFELQNVECGDYILMALGPDGCRGIQFARLTKERGKDPARIQMRVAANSKKAKCGPSQ
jgi:hypothetical protein